MLACEVNADSSLFSAREALSIRDKAKSSTAGDDVEKFPTSSGVLGVAVRHVKLEPDQPLEGAETSMLVFDVYNETGGSIREVIVSVALVEATAQESRGAGVVVGPFKIRLKEALLADYSVHYELRLRNLSADCRCLPTVEVLDARVLLDSERGSTMPLK